MGSTATQAIPTASTAGCCSDVAAPAGAALSPELQAVTAEPADSSAAMAATAATAGQAPTGATVPQQAFSPCSVRAVTAAEEVMEFSEPSLRAVMPASRATPARPAP